MSQYAFIVALPVTDVGVTNEPAVPVRFEKTMQGAWWVVYADPSPKMLPVPESSPVIGRRGGRNIVSHRRKDSRSVLLLRPIAHHVATSRAVFVAVSEDLGFLKWAKDKATNAGYATWTKDELQADDSVEATWLKSNSSDEDRAEVRLLLAGMESDAFEGTLTIAIDAAIAIPEH